MKKNILLYLITLILVSLTACVPVHRTNPGYGYPPVHVEPIKKPPVALNSRIHASKKDLVILKSWANAADNKNKIKICLINSTAKGKWKAMYYKDGKPPKKFQAKGKNSSSCAHYYPGYKTFFFWKKGFLGKKKMIKTYSINLSEYVGHHINFEWVRD